MRLHVRHPWCGLLSIAVAGGVDTLADNTAFAKKGSAHLKALKVPAPKK
jgi:hypothetical protein